METVIYDQVKEGREYHWMIQYAKDHPELDFLTGSNKNNSWFSVYRGTSKIIKIEKSGKSKIPDEKRYHDLYPDIMKTQLNQFIRILFLTNLDYPLYFHDTIEMNQQGKRPKDITRI